MKRMIPYFLVLLGIISCNDFSPKTENATAEEAIDNANTSVETTSARKEIKDLSTFDLLKESMQPEIEEKLQANYEALLLLTKHPEFKEAIQEQLEDSNKFSEALSDSIQKIQIKDVQYIGNLKVINDSVSVQKIRYTLLVNSTFSQKDSANVVMKQSIVEIDETQRIRADISFQNVKK